LAAGIAMSKSRWDKSCRAASTRRQRNCAEACSRAVCRRASWIRFGKRSADGFLLPPNERSSRNAGYLCSAAGPFRKSVSGVQGVASARHLFCGALGLLADDCNVSIGVSQTRSAMRMRRLPVAFATPQVTLGPRRAHRGTHLATALSTRMRKRFV
jgi:hypothetical protein